MDAMLEARPVALSRASRLLRLDPAQARRLLVTLAGLHDLGKFSPAFQAQVLDRWEALRLHLDPLEPLPGRHTEDGLALWIEGLSASLGERIWPEAPQTLEALAPAVFGHHGRPVEFKARRALQGFPPQAMDAARTCATAIVALLCHEPIGSPELGRRSARIASWYVAGLMTTADWIGSGSAWFDYTEPLPDDPTLGRYWNEIARPRAAVAVREAGLLAPRSAALRPFREVAGLKGEPTPLQRWAESVVLPLSPCLLVIEDVTGSGKTEAAQMIVHRLLTEGRVSGAYWGMPTQATANAMYERQARMLDGLFASVPGVNPSLVLAHGQQRLHRGFQNTVLRGATGLVREGDFSDDSAGGESQDELSATAGCAAFLADDRRAALLADIGSGTIDQALLAVLPSRFNAVRLVGLADKVLVIDEAHAYDAYMTTELEQMLNFQAALGGCAVVLSATLPQEKRAALANAWMEGLHLGDGSTEAPKTLQSTSLEVAYPLATLVSADGATEWPLNAAEWSQRAVEIRWVHEVDRAFGHIQEAAAAGAATVWIRNTVDDCLAAAEMLSRRGVKKLLTFHARFAQSDRQAREAEVLARFGRGAIAEDRAGWVLIATQVVEQSLDLDFDVMLSDLAPVDLLVQRVGRLWRHPERDQFRPRDCVRELVLLSPPRDSDPPEDWLGGQFRGTAAVYRNHGVLWRTVEVLNDAGRIVTPEGIRGLVESVYGSDTTPDSLLRHSHRAEARELSDMSVAKYGTLKVAHGYQAGQQPWVDELRVPTRLGEETTTVRLARVMPDGSLVPWASTRPEWRAWVLSEVRVRATRIPHEAAPLPEYEAAAAVARRGWGRFERDQPILPLSEVESGRYTGQLVVPDRRSPIGVVYSGDSGLSFVSLSGTT